MKAKYLVLVSAFLIRKLYCQIYISTNVVTFRFLANIRHLRRDFFVLTSQYVMHLSSTKRIINIFSNIYA